MMNQMPEMREQPEMMPPEQEMGLPQWHTKLVIL
jgi:hypothetical protein